MDKASYLDFIIEIIRRCDDLKGFKVLPRRWVVERTFGWMSRWRRLVRDYEQRIDVSQAMIMVAIGGLICQPSSIARFCNYLNTIGHSLDMADNRLLPTE